MVLPIGVLHYRAGLIVELLRFAMPLLQAVELGQAIQNVPGTNVVCAVRGLDNSQCPEV